MTQFDPERPSSSWSAPGPDAWAPRREPPQQWAWSDQGGQPQEQWPGYPRQTSAQQAEWAAQSWQPVPGTQIPSPPAANQKTAPPPTGRPLSPADEKTWSVLAHAGVPIFGVFSAGLIYLLLRDRGPFVRDNATEALNWSIVYTIATVGSAILTAFYVGAVLWPLVFVAAVVFGALGAAAASRGEVYRYPFTWRLAR